MSELNKFHFEEYERKIRHVMCVFLSLETFFIWFITVELHIDDCISELYEYGSATIPQFIDMLRYHHYYVTPDIVITPIYWIVCLIPIIFTFLSMCSQPLYIIYEILHCILGILLLIFLGILGIIIFLILSWRFIIYIFLTNSYK